MSVKRVLVVDDNPDMVELLTLRLQVSNYDVITAADGIEALEKTKTQLPDLIILDVMMPFMNGYDVCKTLKFDKEYEKILILLLTACAQQSDRDMGQKVKADAFMNKPFEGEELMTKIEELFKQLEG